MKIAFTGANDRVNQAQETCRQKGIYYSKNISTTVLVALEYYKSMARPSKTNDNIYNKQLHSQKGKQEKQSPQNEIRTELGRKCGYDQFA